jgi:LysM repeat protein
MQPARRAPLWGLVGVLGGSLLASAPTSASGSMSAVGRSPVAQTSGSTTDGAEGETDPEKKTTREWVTHRVVPRERLDDIAVRYGVSRDEIVRWNKRLKKSQWIYAGQKLKVYARKVPPPREKITYVVERGDTWSGIAKKYNVQAEDLRQWNRKVPRAFMAGTKLVVYTNPLLPPPGEEADLGSEAPLPVIHVKAGGIAVGRPNRGKLVGGVRLDDGDMFKVRDPDKAYGTTHTVQHLQEAVAKFRRDTGFDKHLVVGAISLRHGGRFRPHSSHQTGRDVDLRLPKRKGADEKSSSASDIDWALSWKLVESLIDTGEVEYIFLDWVRQKRLYRAAQAAGASKKRIQQAIQYPRAKKTNHGVVRHADGHNIHIHIRFKCAPGNSRCESY